MNDKTISIGPDCTFLLYADDRTILFSHKDPDLMALKKKMQIAQNKVIRFINQLGPRTRITSDILMNLNLLNVKTR